MYLNTVTNALCKSKIKKTWLNYLHNPKMIVKFSTNLATSFEKCVDKTSKQKY